MSLSKEARAARAPRPPEELVDALQDRIHPTSGRLIAAMPIGDKKETQVSVNDRLREQLAFLQAQNAQFRLIMGILTHRLGDAATVSQDDFVELQRAGAEFSMTSKPGALTDDGRRLPDELEMKVLIGDDAKKAREEQQRLIIPGR